jgi:hypothetical protein
MESIAILAGRAPVDFYEPTKLHIITTPRKRSSPDSAKGVTDVAL